MLRSLSDKYVRVSDELAVGFNALFSAYGHLNIFMPDNYAVQFENEGKCYNEAELSRYIFCQVSKEQNEAIEPGVARSNEDITPGPNEPLKSETTSPRKKKYNLVLPGKIAKGGDGKILDVATFAYDQDKTLYVKFNHVVKVSTYSDKIPIDKEKNFTNLGADSLKMQIPFFVTNEQNKKQEAYLIMKRLAGMDLAHLLEQQYEKIKNNDEVESEPAPASIINKLTSYDLLNLILKIGEAILELHQKNIIHGDLKPSNIFIKHDLSVQLIDFRYAKKTDEKDIKICGSPPYLDPHVLSGLCYGIYRNYSGRPENEKEHVITKKSEVFTYGLIIGEILNAIPELDLKAISGLKIKLSDYLKLCFKRNENFQLTAINMPELEPNEIEELSACINQAFKYKPEDRPEMKNFLENLKNVLEPILKKLKPEPTGVNAKQLLREKHQTEQNQQKKELGLKRLQEVLLFKEVCKTPVTIPSSSPNHSFCENKGI